MAPTSAAHIEATLTRARARADAGDFAAARALLDSLGAEADDSSLVHHVRGSLALQAGDAQAAAAHFRAAVALEPDVAEHRTGLGSALLAQARHADKTSVTAVLTEAREELARAWALRPRVPDVGATYAFALELSGRAPEALEILEAVLAVHPGHPAALFNKASALKALGRLDDARAALDTLLAHVPGFAPAREARARL